MRAHPQEAREMLDLDVGDEEFLDFLHLYDLSVVYVNRKATGGNLAYGLSQMDEPHLATTLLTGDDTMVDVGNTIDQIERERHDASENADEPRLDVLIATNIISHGVDLERINFLCMAGMPSKYAEYIQASSRAARNHVGLVLVCFKRSDLRERSQYHYFLPNHRYLDNLVEPVPINRFSSYAPERTVPGLIAGLLLTYYSRSLFEQGRITKSLDDLRELRKAIEAGVITREQILEDIQEIIGANHPRLDELERRYLIEAIDGSLERNWDQIMRSLESFLTGAIHPMLSFRDVDETLEFVGDGPASVFAERLRDASRGRN
jgi:superfamily II DNA/RNA helicase